MYRSLYRRVSLGQYNHNHRRIIYIPIIRIRRKRVRTRQVREILGVTSSIACRRDVLHVTNRLVISRDGHLANFVGDFNDGRYKAHLDVPFDVTMEQPDARIARLVAEDNVAVCVHCNGVTSHGYLGEVSGEAVESSFSGHRPFAHLKLVAVEVERMDGCVEVIHHNLNDVTFLYDEGIDGPIDLWICVLRSCADCCKERRYFLRNVSYVVEICPLFWLASWQVSSLRHLPWYAQGIKPEIKIQVDFLGWIS